MGRKRLLGAAALLWLGCIFAQSLRSGAASSAQSQAAAGAVQTLLEQAGLTGVTVWEPLLRKLAHFAEFAVLGLLTAAALAADAAQPSDAAKPASADAAQRPHAGPEKKAQALAAALFGLLAGLLDETLQLFCPGRAALVSDVWLDWAGFLCGAAAVVLLRAVRARCARARRRQKEAQC